MKKRKPSWYLAQRFLDKNYKGNIKEIRKKLYEYLKTVPDISVSTVDVGHWVKRYTGLGIKHRRITPKGISILLLNVMYMHDNVLTPPELIDKMFQLYGLHIAVAQNVKQWKLENQDTEPGTIAISLRTYYNIKRRVWIAIKSKTGTLNVDPETGKFF